MAEVVVMEDKAQIQEQILPAEVVAVVLTLLVVVEEDSRTISEIVDAVTVSGRHQKLVVVVGRKCRELYLGCSTWNARCSGLLSSFLRS